MTQEIITEDCLDCDGLGNLCKAAECWETLPNTRVQVRKDSCTDAHFCVSCKGSGQVPTYNPFERDRKELE